MHKIMYNCGEKVGGPYLIEVSNVSKSFGKVKVLNKVSLRVENGDIVGYVGLNGAGKTTTIRIIVGVLNPDEGSVVVDGYDMFKDKRRASKRIGWVPELPNFEGEFKALDYFVYLAGYYGISKSEALRIGKELMEKVGLGEALNKKLIEYSQGMKKRFALAVSMISDPQNFVFDEVLNGLDPQGIAFFRELTKEFKKENRAVLFSSHILKEMEQIADKVVFIHKGRIIGIYAMEEIARIAKPVLRIKLLNVSEEALSLLRNYGDISMEGSEIFVKLHTGERADEIVAELVKKGIGVKEFKSEERDLESFFFDLIKRGEGA